MQSQKIILAQKQQLKMSPQMYQSLELMALPMLDLRERIQTEIEKNPALDIQPSRDVSYDRLTRTERGPGYDAFENSSDPGYIRTSNSGGGAKGAADTESHHGFIEGALSRGESLQGHLLTQLHLSQLTDEELQAGELIISNLDRNGFYGDRLTALFTDDQLELRDRAIALIRQMDPPGICVDGVISSLVLQAHLNPMAPPFTEEVITNHLEDIRRGRLSDIAKTLHIDTEDVEYIIQFIKTLNPFPGSVFAPEGTQYIIPDIVIQKHEGRLRFRLNDEHIPTLSIDPDFEAIAESQEEPSSSNEQGGVERKEADRFIQRSIRDARWLINSIEMRNSTLRRLGAALMKHQLDFFLKGPKYLRPLTLKDIAEEISVHETTVSRISHAKYVQTDWGIFPVKYFFTNAVSGSSEDGGNLSKTGVKEVIREIIEGYTGSKRLSDQRIADLLAERGITVARRTVAKYRGELNIDSSFQRS